MSQSLAVAYRPKTFEEVVGQSITTEILKKQIENKTFKNAYLFSGHSGVGKTSIARIFARMINNGVGDPIEKDATTFGVDDARNLAEEAKQRAIAGEYKIFIIDECHRLGGDKKDAWNALLKVIEECPKYTIFIFCTTEPEKVIPTVRNRLQRYNFTPISAPEIRARLEYICQQEGFTNYEQTCDYISKSVQGGMRDAITYLEQISDYSKDLNIEVAKKDLERYKNLYEAGAVSKQTLDAAQAKYDSSKAQQVTAEQSIFSDNDSKVADADLKVLKAQKDQAEVNLSYTNIYAPQSGTVASRRVEKGMYVQVGTPLFTIVPDDIWVVANYKENQLRHMKPGQPVDIKVDTYPNKVFKGKVDSIQRSSGAKASLFPPENAVGSFVKIVQRVPVKIIFTEEIDPEQYNVVPGMSVVPKVKIR